ncbi:VVA0879 family protein [Streptomyces sp. NPDC088794]|uniref:VVA0879 family protein n=1 Tax=Streptomyces sp. NPDC088794 TaxID=3365902 RepID=UPI003804305A
MSPEQSPRTLTHDELTAEATARFGKNPLDWAFVCPNCGDIASTADLAKALADFPSTRRDGTPVRAEQIAGQECIGRTLGALNPGYTGRGCTWAAYGLIPGPWTIHLSEGRTRRSFRLAPVPQEVPRVLSIRQPWAFAVAEGFKPIENRSQRTHHRGPIFIHASRLPLRSVAIVRYSDDAAIRLDELGGSQNLWDARAHIPSSVAPAPHATLALSAVIATAQLTGCHQADDCCGPWGFPDQWHWEITDVHALREAVPQKGALGLRKAPPELVTAVRNAASTGQEATAG